MHRVISAFRLLMPMRRQRGPLVPTAGSGVPPEAIGEFLDALYVAVEKLRDFGYSDEDFGGPIQVVARDTDERANGRYFPKDDRSVIFFPPVRGAPDWPWTIIHEVAHRVWHKLLSKEGQKTWEIVANSMGKPIDGHEAEALAKMVQNRPDGNNMWFFFKKHFGPDLEMFKQWLQTKRVSDSFPSDYANADPAESFAEVMADVILGRGHAGRSMRRTGSMVRKVFLSLVEPFRNKETKVVDEAMLLEQQDENFLQVQVEFPQMRERLAAWIGSSISSDDIIKMPRSPHATVVHGADKRDLDGIQRIASDFGRPVRMSMGALNVFENEAYDVLYVELVGDALYTIRDEILELPNSREQPKAYVPHMTVAYLKKGHAKKFIGMFPFRGIVMSFGLTIIDASGTENLLATSPDRSLDREPLLLAAG